MERLTTKLHDFGAVLYTNEVGKHLSPAELSVGQTREVLHKLCEYEETGFTPEQIMEMKKSANIKKCLRKGIVGIPKSGARILLERVSERGIIIDSVLYGIPVLIQNYQGEKVKIRIVDNIATVFDLDTGEQIVWFELSLPNGVNCKHSFILYTNGRNMSDYGCTCEEIAKALKKLKTLKRFK